MKDKHMLPGQGATTIDPSRASALTHYLALSSLAGGVSADKYFFTVLLAIPNVRGRLEGKGPAPALNHKCRFDSKIGKVA